MINARLFNLLHKRDEGKFHTLKKQKKFNRLFLEKIKKKVMPVMSINSKKQPLLFADICHDIFNRFF